MFARVGLEVRSITGASSTNKSLTEASRDSPRAACSPLTVRWATALPDRYPTPAPIPKGISRPNILPAVRCASFFEAYFISALFTCPKVGEERFFREARAQLRVRSPIWSETISAPCSPSRLDSTSARRCSRSFGRTPCRRETPKI